MPICGGVTTERASVAFLHPNGICLIGQWPITEQTQYSGYFAKDSAALAIGRYSTCCTKTLRGPQKSIRRVELGPLHGAVKNAELMAERQDFKLQSCAAP